MMKVMITKIMMTVMMTKIRTKKHLLMKKMNKMVEIYEVNVEIYEVKVCYEKYKL